jgi:hypothetical protein
MGSPNYGAQIPPVPPAPAAARSSNATTALVLGIISLVCCALCGPIAWYLGNKELKAIRAGVSPIGGEGFAKAGMILGIIGTVLLAVWLIWVVLFGGLAVVSSILESSRSY